ncbi:MAG: hypothetical protein RIQ89_2306 [Bacteroidota bacterium]
MLNTNLNIAHFSTSDKGGAGMAAARLHQLLYDNGITSCFISKYLFNESMINTKVINQYSQQNLIRKAINRFNPSLYQQLSRRFTSKDAKHDYFSFPYGNPSLHLQKEYQQANIIHVHWAVEDFLDWPTFFSDTDKKFVFTLHDMHLFTGGCHHADECTNFQSDCSYCPQLNEAGKQIAMKMLLSKLACLQGHHSRRIKIIAPSSWMIEQSRSSKLFSNFQHFKIPNIVPHTTFLPNNFVSEKLKLAGNRKRILFVSNDIDNYRKGTSLLAEACKHLDANEVVLMTVGKVKGQLQDNMMQIDFGFLKSEETMASIFAAADLFVLPSMAENFPNTIVESLLQGTPVIATKVGGIVEQLDESNGILISPSSTHLVEAIVKALFNRGWDRLAIQQAARIRYSPKQILADHLNVYSSFFHD